jgi:hypothetical protein
MKKRIITVMVATAALLTLTAAPSAAAVPVYRSSSGVLVRQDDGYMIQGTLRADGRVVGTIHGALIEQTTGFNTCPDFYFFCFFSGFSSTCNLLGGDVTFNFQGTIYEARVFGDIQGRVQSYLCRDPDDPTIYRLATWDWSETHTIPGEFPDLFTVGGSVRQISPTLFKWTSP